MITLSRKDTKTINVVKGSAASVVVLAHVYQLLLQPSFSNKYVNFIVYTLGSYSVYIFFVVSGFLIYFSIYNQISINRNRKFSFSLFIKKRIVRLYPPLIFVLLFMGAYYFITIQFNLDYLVGREVDPTRTEIALDSGYFASFFFAQNMFVNVFDAPSFNGPLWSLSHEFWFYVLIGLLSLNREQPLYKRVLVSAILFLFIFILPLKKDFYMGFIVWLCGFFCGYLYGNKITLDKRLFFILLIMSIIFWLSLLLLKYFWLSKYTFGIIFAVLFSSILQVGCNENFITQSLQEAGKYSYTLYIIHWPLLMISYQLFYDYVIFDSLGLLMISFISLGVIYSFSSYVSQYIEGIKIKN
ncbi:acyltransferase family protein [Vibrio breoganii]|uniref:acyltransferase family protein n=1 Tax=Vibrio breoganii TaxID=553239 RepID=UPI000C835082|nr:acyltransferase [Vibrio breoganii]PMG97748.1 hypothetical protein BCU80_18335 [Vibrio breoganii]